MPDGPDNGLPDEQVDVVQHPTLGTLKFPKEMPFDQRNQIIDGMENKSDGSESKGDPGTIRAAPSTSQKVLNAGKSIANAAVNSKFPYIHPLDAISAAQDSVLGATSPIENYTQQGRAEHPILSRIGDVTSRAKELGGIVAPEVGLLSGGAGLAEEAPKVAGSVSDAFNTARTAVARKAIQPLVYEGPGEAMVDTRLGQMPERGIVREGITGTKEGMASKAGDRIGELKSRADQILQNHPNANVQIDATPHIDAAIDSAIANAKQTAGSTDRLEALRQELKSSYGKTTGTPYEINNLKSSIQDAANRSGAYKNTSPEEGTVANALRDTAKRIKDQVNATVPDVAPVNERMADLADARSGLNRKVAIGKGEDLFSGDLTAFPARLLRRTVGSAPVRSGIARLATLGLKEDLPEVPFSYAEPNIDASSAHAVPYNRLARVSGREYHEPRGSIVTPPNTSGSSVTAEAAEPGLQRGKLGRISKVYSSTAQQPVIGQTAELGEFRSPEPKVVTNRRMNSDEVREAARTLASPDATAMEKFRARERLRADEGKRPQ